MPKNSEPTTVLLVGVLPPPVHGQSVATKIFFDSDLHPVRKIIVGIRSSKSISTVGRFSIVKALGILPLILKLWTACLRYRPRVLYYTAGSGAWVPFIRDIIVLCLVRPLCKRTLIHYHSGDLVDFLMKSRFHGFIGKFIYGRGAWTIRLGPTCSAPSYPENLVFDIPNGIEPPPAEFQRSTSPVFRILFLGNLFESKGVFDLITAVSILAGTTTRQIELKLIGDYVNESTSDEIVRRLALLPSNVSAPTPAPAYGDKKWKALSDADVLVFPSYYRRENLPLVVIEAMAMGLPVIGSEWRGIPSLIEHGRSGYVVPICSPQAISEALIELNNNPSLGVQLGYNARLLYQKHFTISHFVGNLKILITKAADNKFHFKENSVHS